MFGLFKGLGVTISQMPKKKVTLMYPEEKPVWPDRYRGVHKFYPDLCIVCNQCSRICPTSCISLSGSRGEDKKLHIETFDINFEICILCDLCVEVCPTEAVQMTDTFELAEYNRDALYKNMDWLVENGRQHDERKGLHQEDTPEAAAEDKAAEAAAGNAVPPAATATATAPVTASKPAPAQAKPGAAAAAPAKPGSTAAAPAAEKATPAAEESAASKAGDE